MHANSLQSCLTLYDPMDSSSRLVCPCDSSGKNTGVDCHALLQGIFLTQGWNPCLLRCRGILTAEPPGKPLSPAVGSHGVFQKKVISPQIICQDNVL